MNDLQDFLRQQKKLAEMPEGDIEDYEARLHLRAKRGRLWRPDDDRLMSASQEEREASELRSLIPSDEMPCEHVTKEAIDIAELERQANSATGEKSSGMKTKMSSPFRHGLEGEMGDEPNHRIVGKSGSASDKRGYSSSGKGRGSPHKDSRPAVVSGEDRNGERTAKNRNDDPSGPPTSFGNRELKVSNNQITNLREKVLKKRKDPESNEPIIADSSNITSPSSSPAGPSAPSENPRTLSSRWAVESASKERKLRKAEKDKQAAARKREEDLEKRMTPREYASHVQSKFADYLAKTPLEKLSLRDKAIFYIGGDYSTASQSTRRKMDHLRKKGATVVPKYDPQNVTHIVTEGNAAVTLKALGLTSLDEIPMYIPTLTWSWVTDGKSGSPEFWFAAFPSRIDASSENRPELTRTRRFEQIPRPIASTDEDYSRIEDFTVAEHVDDKSTNERPENDQESVKFVAKNTSSDPLAEFYDQALEELQAEQKSPNAGDRSSEDEKPISSAKGTRSRWTCDQRPVGGTNCVNQDIVDKLSELEEINKTKVSGDPREQRWRVFSYGKSIRAIRAHPKRIRNFEDAISIRGIGDKTARKIIEIIETGDLQRIKYDNTDDVRAIKLFSNIYGVGLRTAERWYIMGCRTLDDIKNGKGGVRLSEVQEIGLKYYEDINTRVPRDEVEEIFNMIKSIALGIDPKLSFLLMGSYRRGSETCGDIDILMTRPTDDGKTHRGVLRVLLKELHLQGILTEDLAIPEDFDDLEQTFRGLCRRDEKSLRRRIDILAVPYHERGGALIYYTGDDIFNRAIRLKAKSMGYSLSQHGLGKRAMRDSSGKRMVPVELIASESEEEIFRILGVPWQEPHERVRALPTGGEDRTKNKA